MEETNKCDIFTYSGAYLHHWCKVLECPNFNDTSTISSTKWDLFRRKMIPNLLQLVEYFFSSSEFRCIFVIFFLKTSTSSALAKKIINMLFWGCMLTHTSITLVLIIICFCLFRYPNLYTGKRPLIGTYTCIHNTNYAF